MLMNDQSFPTLIYSQTHARDKIEPFGMGKISPTNNIDNMRHFLHTNDN